MGHQRVKNKKGLTLIEVLVYISVISLSILSFTSYFLMMNTISVKNKAISSIESDSKYIFNLFEDKILNAREIIFPEEGSASSSLILENTDGSNIKFFLNDGVLKVSEDDFEIYQITSNEDEMTNLEFSVSKKDVGNVKVSFVFKRRNIYSKEFTYERKYYNSYSLKSYE